MDDYGGRPHWGKRHYQSAATLRDALPGLGPLRRRCATRLDPERPVPQRLHATACWAS